MAAGPGVVGAAGKGVNGDFEKDYYVKETRPTDIFVSKDVDNPSSENLRKALKKAEKGK